MRYSQINTGAFGLELEWDRTESKFSGETMTEEEVVVGVAVAGVVSVLLWVKAQKKKVKTTEEEEDEEWRTWGRLEQWE